MTRALQSSPLQNLGGGTVFQMDAMRVLVEAAEWASWAMGNTAFGVPEVRLVRRSSSTWHFSGAPEPCEIFKITNARHLVFDDVFGMWMSNWCHVGKGASLVSKWQVSNVEGELEEWEEEGEEQDQAEQEGQQEQENRKAQEEEQEQEQEKAWSVCLHLHKDSLLMEYEGDCGTSTVPGISRGTARYARVLSSGTGRREEGAAEAATVEEPLQPLRDGQVELHLLLSAFCNLCCSGLPFPEGDLLVAQQGLHTCH